MLSWRTNINFLGNNTVSSIDKNENGQYEIHFADNDKTITVDERGCRTGLIVDGRLPNRAGIRFAPQQGIIVDNQTLQTSQADVYAIGDCMAIDGQDVPDSWSALLETVQQYRAKFEQGETRSALLVEVVTPPGQASQQIKSIVSKMTELFNTIEQAGKSHAL